MKTMLLLGLLAFSGCLCANPVKGSKVGTIVSVADEGVICTTHEGVLQRGGLQGGTGAMGQTISLNFVNDEVAQDARAAMESGKEVEVIFHRTWVASLCSRENAEDVIVTKVVPR